ncbi:MAG TPA: DUF3341 domain-containing protein [Polyangia bacterium]|jgi:hypothetical protein|nr:DUF3341 domain-containing protein [Polyangia bacterium]
MRQALLAEFASAEALLQAVRACRRRGYERMDAFTPFPVRGLEEALGLRRSGLNWAVFPIGAAGAAGALFIQWFANAWDYDINVGGRPPFALPAFIPITFEMTVLLSAFAAFFGLWWLLRLPRLAHPVFQAEGFESASNDRFWLGIDARDPYYDALRTSRELDALGALRVRHVGEEGA